MLSSWLTQSPDPSPPDTIDKLFQLMTISIPKRFPKWIFVGILKGVDFFQFLFCSSFQGFTAGVVTDCAFVYLRLMKVSHQVVQFISTQLRIVYSS